MNADSPGILLALEGGGTRSQAALLDGGGRVLQSQDSIAVNTNFVSQAQAQQAVFSAVEGVLRASGIRGGEVRHFATSLVGAQFGAETFKTLCPRAAFRSYPELKVVFAQAGIYRPHGVGLVAATGATAWAVRGDNGRDVFYGGWGSLLGDEGSAYAMGLMALRSAARAYEHRTSLPTRLVEAVCEHFNLSRDDFRRELVQLTYQKPLGRTEIAGLAPVVTRLALEGDPMALRIVEKVINDLSALALSAARQLFTPAEAFDLVVAGGMTRAGSILLGPLENSFKQEFPLAVIKIGSEAPATALGRLALFDIKEELC